MKNGPDIEPGTSQRALRRLFGCALIGVLFLLGSIALPARAHAQQVRLPRKGMQYFTFGLSLDPGFIYDPGAAEHAGEGATGLQPSKYALAGAGMAEVGLTQIINSDFFMSAEGRIGLQWVREHTAALNGLAPSSTSLAWQLGLYAQWLPFGDQVGLVSTGGIHLFRVHLDDAPLQVLAAEFRLGKYIWTADEHFLLVQVGYSLPLIQGLSHPTEFGDNADWADEDWSFHRFSLGFEYGF